jgi:hypothetical protein
MDAVQLASVKTVFRKLFRERCQYLARILRTIIADRRHHHHHAGGRREIEPLRRSHLQQPNPP